jgi:hypothetical protein
MRLYPNCLIPRLSPYKSCFELEKSVYVPNFDSCEGRRMNLSGVKIAVDAARHSDAVFRVAAPNLQAALENGKQACVAMRNTTSECRATIAFRPLPLA